jgi:glutamyl-tRNA synthetase
MTELTSDSFDRPVRTRFAPSPTGFLHVGAFRTALFSWLVAKKFGGQFILRVEDTDQARVVPGSLESLIRSMQALGIMYDEGPDKSSVAALDIQKYGAVDPSILPDFDGEYGPYFQSQRLTRYSEVLEQLLEEGKAYYAFETQEELDAQRAVAMARKIPFLYSRRYRDFSLGESRDRIAKGEPAVIRFKMPVSGPIRTVDALRGETIWDATTMDDFIIQKSDGFPPYHLAAIVDDHDMLISHVLRGEEWIPSFPKHVCLVQALGWEQPIWIHAPSVLGTDKKKLSKRHGAKPLIGPVPELKDGELTGDFLSGLINQEGYLPEALVNFLALIGWSPGDDREVMPLSELLSAFSVEAISTAPGIFDADKLLWMNGVYIRNLSREDFVQRALPFLQNAKLLPDNPNIEEVTYASVALELEQERVKRLDEVSALTDFFFPELPVYSEKSVANWLRKGGATTAAYLSAVASSLSNIDPWNETVVEQAVRNTGIEFNREKGELTHPVRVAVTGRETGPGLFETIAAMGKKRTLTRLAHAVELARG